MSFHVDRACRNTFLCVFIITRIGPSEFNVSGTLRTWSIVDDVWKITAPTLLINAYDDTAQDIGLMPFFEKVQQVKWVQFANSSHLPAFEEPERYFTILGQFLLN